MSSFDVVQFYQMATVNLYRIGGPILVFIGTIGGFICLLVFGQKSMRRSTGSIYFIAFNIANILLLWIGLFPSAYRYITDIDLTIVNLAYCRLKIYLLNTLIILPPSYLILASIDRKLLTSRDALTRQRSTRRLAFWTIGAVTLLWLLYYFPMWFFVHIQSFGPGILFCFFDPGTYFTFMSYSTLIVTGFLPPLLMTIFGFMTIRNFRQHRLQPTSNISRDKPLSSKDRQLAIMLLFEIGISLVFSSVGASLYAYTQRMSNDRKTMEQQALDNFLLDFGLNLVFLQASISPYSNFIVSKQFRKHVQKMIWKIIPYAGGRHVINHSHNMSSTLNNMHVTAGTIQMHTIITQH